MKKLYFLDEEEKNRILNLHENATKRHYLGEQATSTGNERIITDNPNDKAYDYMMKDNKYYFKGKPNTTYATKYPNWQEAKATKGINAIKALFDKNINVTQTEVKPVTNTNVKPETNTDPSKAAVETAKVVQTGVSPVGTTPVGTNAGSGVVSVNANDIIATPAVAGTPATEPTSQFKSQTLPDFKGYTAPKTS